MKIDLAGRRVLITGASDGIGRTLAKAFSDAGAHVAGCARNQSKLDLLKEEINRPDHFFVRSDVTKKEELENFYRQAVETLGGVDILINNVGSIGKLSPFFDLDDDDWQDSFSVNLLPPVRLIRLSIDELRKSLSPRIINISSIAGSRPGEVFPHYSAMKAALSNLTVSLAQSLAKDKILVNSVSPGPVWTESWDKEARLAHKNSDDNLDSIRESIKTSTAETVPLKRMGLPEDVSGLVLFLASDLASWITASNFIVDGGVLQNPY